MTALRSQVTTVGITGTIGSGKSTVGKILEGLGVPVIDSDEIVHSLLASDAEAQKLVAARFGSKIILNKPDSQKISIDRRALAQIVFKDPQARADLEAILHPRVRKICQQRINEYAKEPSIKLVACLVPLLFEAHLADEYRQTWAVIADERVLKDRLRQRDNFSQSELESRLASQWPQTEKARLADKVIDNSGDLIETKRQVLDLVNNLMLTKNTAPPASGL